MYERIRRAAKMDKPREVMDRAVPSDQRKPETRRWHFGREDCMGA